MTANKGVIAGAGCLAFIAYLALYLTIVCGFVYLLVNVIQAALQ